MFDLNEFLLELDHMYATNPKGVEAYLKSGLEEAGKCLDAPAMLTILNELMGYYRVMSKPTECEWCIEKAARIAEKLGIQGTTDYATMLLNIGTAQRVMGQMDKAESNYEEAYAIFKEKLHEPDYRMATLYNNRSILYANTGRLKEAKADLQMAMGLIQRLEQSDVEVVMSREDDRGLYDTSIGSRKMSDMKNRCARVEESGADLVVSIHQNSYHQEDVSGAQVFYYRKSEKGKRLAEILQKRFDYALGDQNRRKAKPNDSYYLLLHVKCPIVIVECGFLSNWKEAALLKTEEYQDRVAYTLHMGIMEYLNGR